MARMNEIEITIKFTAKTYDLVYALMSAFEGLADNAPEWSHIETERYKEEFYEALKDLLEINNK